MEVVSIKYASNYKLFQCDSMCLRPSLESLSVQLQLQKMGFGGATHYSESLKMTIFR